MSAKEFILIDDDNNYGEEEITDEEIVNIIKSNETDLAEEEINLQPKISTSEALESLDKKIAIYTGFQKLIIDVTGKIGPILSFFYLHDDWLKMKIITI
ncbi:hypothetical protein RclHR1_01950020 [Rhizophagus clarus]|uniref:Uncharacterized protein n=1 Tax=Rhizophagus clarus TaxID=94130 RepID=A0A2Z6RHN6_9GLOM|nr:hypothetical protein RclHR1_01950020 [Rhizophagus clarus]